MSVWKCNSCGGTYQDVQRDGLVYMHACPPARTDEHGNQHEINNRRDENIGFNARGEVSGIVSVGAGVTPMQGQAATQPQWIIEMLTQIAAQAQQGR